MSSYMKKAYIKPFFCSNITKVKIYCCDTKRLPTVYLKKAQFNITSNLRTRQTVYLFSLRSVKL